MSVSPPFRALTPLLLVLSLSCKGKDGGNGAPARTASMEIPKQWQSKEAAIVMRITNVSSTSTEVRRALNEIANGDPRDPTDQGVDPLHLLMRLPQTDASGEILEPDPSLSTAEKLAGSSVEQAVAFREKILDGDGAPFSREETVDACGNEMLMTVLSPHAIQKALPQGAQDQPFWPSSCPDGLDCKTIKPGSWDVALGELRYDGMIDMVVNLFPDVRVDPVRPGAFGHLTALFLSDNNPGTLMAPLVANMRRVQINMTGVWELEAAYVDPVGYREIYKFPHRSRELTSGDVFVFLEGDPKGESYWSYLFPEAEQPQGLAGEFPVAIDVTAQAGADIVKATGGADELNLLLQDVLVHQIGAAIACPSVRETAWVRKGPVEFFLCPDIDLATCVATEDLEEGACSLQVEPEANLFAPAVEFPRTVIANVGSTVIVLEDQLPHYLQTPAQAGTVDVQLNVTEGSTLFLRDTSRIQSVVNASGLPITLPTPTSSSHCETDGVQKLALGAEWAPGNYTLTIDLGTGTDWEYDAVSGDSLLWFYYSSVEAWKTVP